MPLWHFWPIVVSDSTLYPIQQLIHICSPLKKKMELPGFGELSEIVFTYLWTYPPSSSVSDIYNNFWVCQLSVDIFYYTLYVFIYIIIKYLYFVQVVRENMKDFLIFLYFIKILNLDINKLLYLDIYKRKSLHISLSVHILCTLIYTYIMYIMQ